ncbi:MAG: 6-phosphofructokinase, partial [Akkermansiaceae bacterium]
MRIGVLTGGGDCPGLNAVIHGVVGAAHKLGWEVIGFKDGFEGLLPPGDYRILTPRDTIGILKLGGTILGST